jgi:hypothetical protein
MRTFLILTVVFAICLLSPFIAMATTYLPDETGELYWTGFGAPGCEPFPPEAVATYTIETAPAGSTSWVVLVADLPHVGVGTEHTYPITLPDPGGHDYTITCFVNLDGQTFWASCEVLDVRVFSVCPGECGARDVE